MEKDEQQNLQKSALVLVAHGSRDPAWAQPFQALARDTGAILAFMELGTPTVRDAVDTAVAAGATRVRVLPLFMAPGAHVRRDIPVLVAELQSVHPLCGIELVPSLGENPRFWAALAEIVRSHQSE